MSIVLRDLRLLELCRHYAEDAERRTRRSSSDEPSLAALLRTVGEGRRRQVERLYATRDKTASAPRADGARVLDVRSPTPDLRVLRLSRPQGFQYQAGQHVKLQLDGLRRPYSLVSAPHEAKLEFFIELVPGGAASAALERLRPGDAVKLGEVSGKLSLDRRRRRHLMVATVTGIAPFISLLRDHLRLPADADLHVLHGASFQDELIYADELIAMANTHGGRVFYMPAVSRPQDPRNRDWPGAAGRIVDLVEGYLRWQEMRPDDTTIYACGNPDMVAAVQERWPAQGYEVRAESY